MTTRDIITIAIIVLIILLIGVIGFIIYKLNAAKNAVQPYVDIASKIGDKIPGVIDKTVDIVDKAAPRIVDVIDKTTQRIDDLGTGIDNVIDLPESKLPDVCTAGYEKDPLGVLCYPRCRPGFKAVGPLCVDDGSVCTVNKLLDLGPTCGRGAPAQIFPWIIGDPLFNFDPARRRCEAHYGAGNCENIGGIWYRKCPAGTTNLGLICGKQSQSYARIGVPPTDCLAGYEKRGALCYPIKTPGINV